MGKRKNQSLVKVIIKSFMVGSRVSDSATARRKREKRKQNKGLFGK